MLNCELWFTDNYIQKARKNFMDSRSRRNINRLNDELNDVQRIMVQNIDEVLQRGETLSGKIFCREIIMPDTLETADDEH